MAIVVLVLATLGSRCDVAPAPEAWLAVGPWPCACGDGSSATACCTATTWRYDLGLIELLLCLALWLAFHRFYACRRAPDGQLVGAVALVYGIVRMPLDFLRVDDAAHLGLTFAQWACLGFIAIGALLLVSTKRG